MPAANRIRPKDVFTDQEWQHLARRQDWRGLALVAHAWGLIIAGIGLFALFPNPLTFLLGLMLVGGRQLGIAILMHDAAHGALHSNQKLNDFLGYWLCGAPLGSSLELYRPYHLSHHKYVQQQEDPDLGLASPFPVTPDSLRRKIIRDLTGQTFLRQRIGGLQAIGNVSADDVASETQAKIHAGRRALRDQIICNAMLFAALAIAGYWWAYAVWLVALATWFPLITRVRNIGEHACIPETDDPLSHARTLHANRFERLFVAPYWVHYHSEHHAFMHLPCYRLKEAHEMLVRKGYGDRIPQISGYLNLLREVTKPTAPRSPQIAAAT